MRREPRRIQLELFELLGIAATIVAFVIFIAFGPKLDKIVGQTGYHWKMLFIVAGIYAHFIPWAIVIGGGGFWVVSRWLKRVRGRYSGLRTERHGGKLRFGIRVFLSYCVLLIVFRVVNFYVPVLHPGIMDSWTQDIDSHLFGGRQISEWLEPLSHRWLTDILTGAYVSWFWLLFATIAILLYVDNRAVKEYVLASLLAFYTGYVCYVIFPVIGPGYTLHYNVILGDIAPSYTDDRLLIARDCFPSLHTAISIVMGIFIWRYQRKWFWLYLPWLALIVFATLYLRFHYAIDDIAGALLGTCTSILAPKLQRRFEAWRDSRRTERAIQRKTAHES